MSDEGSSHDLLSEHSRNIKEFFQLKRKIKQLTLNVKETGKSFNLMENSGKILRIFDKIKYMVYYMG